MVPVFAVPADITSRNDSTAIFSLGNTVFIGNKGYIYGKFDNGTGNVASVAGGLAYWLTYTTTFSFTMDVSDTFRNLVCGIFLGVITDAYFTFLQTSGEHTAVVTNGDDDITAGLQLIPANADGQCDSMAAGTAPTYNVIGVSLAADVDAANTVDTLLQLPTY